ncbi:UNVERIFIED_CONTAM: Multiple organellar RNA editing factor 3, mitochondrial [Sesamum angustifolium]|uniref:Multiple organellar RNA editing factor 3, mitochondrial n=1 Tax=Sesamum angustifolium TaxID=2727405 RepID=A0AAW2LZ51_9LAMI
MAASLFATRRILASVLSRRSRVAVPLLLHHNHEHQQQPGLDRFTVQTRLRTSGSGYSPLNDPSPNWSNRPPKETILLDGCDYEHWLIVMEFNSDPKPTEEEMIDAYVKTLASVVGSVLTIATCSFTCLVGNSGMESDIVLDCHGGLPGVLWVLPDSYLDVPNKDYGGDLFVDGKVIHRPQYRFSERQNTRSRPRPRYDRRRETMQVQKREPMQRETWASNQQLPAEQQTTTASPSVAQGAGGGYPPNEDFRETMREGAFLFYLQDLELVSNQDLVVASSS